MNLTFDQWLASRARFAESEIDASHPCRDLDVDFVALHVFRDGAWIIERHNGKFWTIAELQEYEGLSLTDCAVHLWNLHSSYNCTPAEEEGRRSDGNGTGASFVDIGGTTFPIAKD